MIKAVKKGDVRVSRALAIWGSLHQSILIPDVPLQFSGRGLEDLRLSLQNNMNFITSKTSFVFKVVLIVAYLSREWRLIVA